MTTQGYYSYVVKVGSYSIKLGIVISATTLFIHGKVIFILTRNWREYMRTCILAHTETHTSNKNKKKSGKNRECHLKNKKWGTSVLFQCIHAYMCTCLKKSQPYRMKHNHNAHINQHVALTPSLSPCQYHINQRAALTPSLSLHANITSTNARLWSCFPL